jgi:PST family polysaccharide transporter
MSRTTITQAEERSSHVEKRFLDTEDLQKDLKGRSARGGVVTLSGQIIQFVLHLTGTIILARLLVPEHYGLMAMVAVVTNFAAMFKDMGLSMATVQREKVTHEQISTLFWVNVGVGMLLAALLAALSPVVAWFYEDPRLMPIMIAVSGSYVFSGLGIQHHALLQRKMRFLALEIVKISALFISILSAIAAALLGAGYWSLVTKWVALPVASTILAWVFLPWKPGRIYRGVGVRDMIAFGGNLTGFGVLNYFSRNADNLLIGRIFGASALGLYSKAYQLLMQPLSRLRYPLAAVAIPALSRLQSEPERFKNAFLKILRVQQLPVPLFSVLIVGHEWVVLVILGQKWADAAPIFGWLSLISAVQIMIMGNGLLFIPQNRTGELLRWGIIDAALTVGSFILGLTWGPVGVAAAYSLIKLFISTPLLVFFAGRKGAVSSRDYALGLLPFLVVLVVNVGILYVLRIFIAELAPLSGLVILTTASLAVTTGLYFLLPYTRKALGNATEVVRFLKKK